MSGMSVDMGVVCLSTYDADGFLGIQYDSEGSEAGGLSSGADATPIPPAGGVADYESISPGGLIHRPMDPAVDANGNPNGAQSAQVLNFREGGRTFAFALNDPRTVAILPTMAKGSTMLFSDCGSFVRLEGSGDAVGNISIYTTDDGTPNGYYTGVEYTPSGLTEVAVGGGRRTFDATGFEIVDGSGARLKLGFTGGMPGPLAALSAGFAVMADTATIDAAIVSLGRAGAAGRGAAVRADMMQATLVAPLITALQACATAIEAIGASPAVVGSPPAGAAAAIPVLQAAITALSAFASPTLPVIPWASSGVAVS